jgi:hypothetical protein
MHTDNFVIWSFHLLSSFISFTLLYVCFGFLSQVTSSLPVFWLPIGFHSKSLFAMLLECILCVWPNHLIFWAVINIMIYAALIKWSSSDLLFIFHVFSPVCSRPNVFPRIYLSNIQSIYLPSSLRVHVSEAYVATGLIRINYTLIFVLYFNSFDFKSVAFTQYVVFPL